MLKSVQQLYKNYNRIAVDINDLTIYKKYHYDYYNKVESGDIECRFYHDKKEIGYLFARPHNGQIGKIYIEEKYRGNRLGNSIVEMFREERITRFGKDDLWVVSPPDHKFWLNYKNAVWHEPADKSIKGNGFRF